MLSRIVPLNSVGAWGTLAVFDVVLCIRDLEDSCGRRGGLRHQIDDEAELPHREEQIRQVEAELRPLAERQRSADDLVAAKVKNHRLAEVRDQENHRKKK